MIAVLLDTDILIEIFRRRDQAIFDKWDDLAKSEALILYIS